MDHKTKPKQNQMKQKCRITLIAIIDNCLTELIFVSILITKKTFSK